MDREKISVVLAEAKRLTHHTDYVIMGSLSILGSVAVPPPRMATSIDVDCYPLHDPGRADEISRAIGQGSDFEKEHGFYADALRPTIAALPEGWESRLVRLDFPDDIRAHFLEPNDAAVAKLARCEERDKRWVREGLLAGILDENVIETRIRTAPFLDQAEQDRATKVFTGLRAWALKRRK